MAELPLRPSPLSPRCSKRNVRRLALACVAVFALAACGGDDGSDGDEGDSQSGTTTEPAPTTTTTQPSATDDEEEAFAIVEDLYDERGDLIDELRQNPELLDDPESDHEERLRALVTGDGNLLDAVDTTISATQDLVDKGHREQPAGEVISDSGIYRPVVEDADTISFQVCLIEDIERVDRDGELVDSAIGGMFGLGEAHRIDGIWKLHNLDRDPDADLGSDRLASGALTPGVCDALAGETEEGSS